LIVFARRVSDEAAQKIWIAAPPVAARDDEMDGLQMAMWMGPRPSESFALMSAPFAMNSLTMCC